MRGRTRAAVFGCCARTARRSLARLLAHSLLQIHSIHFIHSIFSIRLLHSIFRLQLRTCYLISYCTAPFAPTLHSNRSPWAHFPPDPACISRYLTNEYHPDPNNDIPIPTAFATLIGFRKIIAPKIVWKQALAVPEIVLVSGDVCLIWRKVEMLIRNPARQVEMRRMRKLGSKQARDRITVSHQVRSIVPPRNSYPGE